MKASDRPRGFLLLLADGFDEVQVTTLISGLRGAGLPLTTVGLKRRGIRGMHGVVIVPDTSLSEVLRSLPSVGVLIIPGGEAAIAAWRADPRFEDLVEGVERRGGRVAVVPEAASLLEGTRVTALPLPLAVQPLETTPTWIQPLVEAVGETVM